MRYAKFDSRLTRDSTSCSIGFSSHVMWCKFKYYSYCTQLYIFTAITNYHIYIYIYICYNSWSATTRTPRFKRSGRCGLDWVQLADGRTRIAEFWARLTQFAVRRIRIEALYISYNIYAISHDTFRSNGHSNVVRSRSLCSSNIDMVIMTWTSTERRKGTETRFFFWCKISFGVEDFFLVEDFFF